MNPYLELSEVALTNRGSPISLTLSRRQTLSVFGPAGSGKSAFLNVCAGRERAEQGSVTRTGKLVLAEPIAAAKKQTPMLLSQDSGGKAGPFAAEALGALKLWEVRKSPLTSLSAGQLRACAMLPALARSADLILIDGVLDGLDIWMLRDATSLLQKRVATGSALVIATHRPEWAARTDALMVLQDRKPVFVGSLQLLKQRSGKSELQIETTNVEGVRALCEPFSISIRGSDGGLLVQAAEGQDLAARLLIEGYGDVKSVVVHEPDARELLEDLIR